MRLIDANNFEVVSIEGRSEEFSDGVMWMLEQLDNASTVEAIPKADYENRLKADMIGMLTEIQLEIEEQAIELCDDGWYLTYNNLIQEKINVLKSESKEIKFKVMYKGQLYFDCKDGVYGINTSSDRKGRFFPFPYQLGGEVDWKKFKRHYNNVYEYVGKIIEAESEKEDADSN